MSTARRLTVFALLVLTAACLVIVGCRQGGTRNGTEKSARPFTAADLPTKPGTVREYVSNDPQVNPLVPVDFGFEGPWDFSQGPIDSLVVMTSVKPSQAPESARFPKATIATSIALKGQEATAMFSYFSKSDKSYLSYGQAGRKVGSDNQVASNVFPTPETVLKFPLKAGMSWSDRIMLQSTPPTRLDVTRKVVGEGAVTVPAGKFANCVMVQIKKALTKSSGSANSSYAYEWYAPGVGIVAWIAGRQDEPDPLFKEASFFERLRKH